jgi:soluble lytic murein transglycosylase-like protein
MSPVPLSAPTPSLWSLVVALAVATALAGGVAGAQPALPELENLPRPSTPPPERGPVVPAQVERWRIEAKALEYGDGLPRDPVRAAQLYCRAARYGDAESQYNLAWMLTNARGIERDDAQAAHLFAAAAEQGLPQALNMARAMGTPQGDPPACLRQPEADPLTAGAPATAPPSPLSAPQMQPRQPPAPPTRAQALASLPKPPPPPNAPPQIVNFVQLVAPEYQLEPWLVLAIMATESNFDPGALSPKNAMGLMQLIPETASRFGVRNALDPTQNIRGGMAYLRWLLSYFEGDITLTLAAYNAGEGAVERYRGVPPYAETRNYVRRIQGMIGYRTLHPFDATVTKPSRLATLIRAQMPAAPR